jgi:diguanylate cyclase (GGDEF)-like protein
VGTTTDQPAVLDGVRLAALRDTELLDGEPDEAFERLNRLAVELLGVPVSLVSLVDEDRQFFAGQVGLPEPWASYRETPLSHAFCQHVVNKDEPLIVEDARSDPLVSDNLAVKDLGVIAYAGMPMRMSDGNVLGSFCAIDSQPHRWSEHDLQILRDLASVASNLIELRHAHAVPALHDPLTALPDRALFAELLSGSLTRAGRGETCTSILALGLDGFRLINEALGHTAGDEILVSVSRRLTEALRESDAVCRVAGDEFLILCESARDEADALTLAKRLRQTVTATPVDIDGHEQPIAATIGVACTSTPMEAEELIGAALAALARAKTGTQRAEPTSRALTESRQRLQLRNAIAGAHERGELHVVYQPLVELSTGQLRGVEALLRWQHPDLGPIPPDQFIPAAEASSAIIAIGEWTLRQALTDLSTWRSQHDGRELALAVNVAPIQLRAANFPDIVASALDHAGLPARSLTLEITERTLLDEHPNQRHTIDTLRALGSRLALDDFGTGYSALGYLTRFPIDILKIDRTFITPINSDPHAAALVQGILAMTRGLHLQTVAEGIETEDQRALLTTMGCELGQGYLLGRPAPAEDITGLLTAAHD